MKRKFLIAGSAMLLALSALAQSGTTANNSKDKNCGASCVTKGNCDKSCCSKDHCDKSKCSQATGKSKDSHSSK